MASRTPPPLPPDPYAEVVARFGVENLEAILATYRQFADRVNYRAMMTWTIKQPLEDLLQPLFLAALVVITKELDLGALAVELQAAQSAQAEPDALAEVLAATARDLNAHIERRAQEIAEPQVRVVIESFSERAAELEHTAAAQKQRDDDLIKELRRQLDAAVKSRDREFDELKRLRAAVFRVKQVRCWQNEDRRWFAFRDDLFAALDGEADPS